MSKLNKNKFMLIIVTFFSLMGSTLVGQTSDPKIDIRIWRDDDSITRDGDAVTMELYVQSRSSDGAAYPIQGYQDGFTLSSNWQPLVRNVTFSNCIFPAIDYDLAHNYYAGVGLVEFIYAKKQSTSNFISIGGSGADNWWNILKVTISFTAAPGQYGSLAWWPNDETPPWNVTRNDLAWIHNLELPMDSPVDLIPLGYPDFDFGDAPAVYGTQTARHDVPASPALYFGAIAPDAELSPAAPQNGEGDDASAADDEDGITLPVQFVPDVAGVVQVRFAKPAGLTVYVRGWFDWNGDGDFGDAEELAFDQAVTDQTSPLLIGVVCPATAAVGSSFARFRISSTQNMTATDAYADGEIEDYAILIDPPDCTVDFAWAATDCANNTIQFADQSSGSVTNWQWDFGDGQTSTAQSPLHVYAIKGSYTVSLQVSGLCATAQISRQVDFDVCPPANLPPIGVNDINNTTPNTTVSGNVLTNDWDPEGHGLAVNTTPVVAPAHGILVLHADGSYTYTPAVSFIGEETFTYRVCDDGQPSLCDESIVTIEVFEDGVGNNEPIAAADVAQGMVNLPITGSVLANDVDPDGNPLTASLLADASHGSVVLQPDGRFIYTPNTGFVGQDSWLYQACDDASPTLCDIGLVSVRVCPDAPGNAVLFAADDAAITRPDTPATGNVLINDFDPNGHMLIVIPTLLSGPSHGSVVIDADGAFSYAPESGYVGQDRFIYLVCDNGSPSQCRQATVYLAVLAAPIENRYDLAAAYALPPASHLYNPAVRIGGFVDAEAVPHDDPLLDGDENNGIVFETALDPGKTDCRVSVTVSQDGYLSAWIDFDGGAAEWSNGLPEQIILQQPVTAGTNTYIFSVPSTIIPSSTVWARFRYTIGPATEVASPIGTSEIAGEVQDYAISLTPVELSTFRGIMTNGLVRLDWLTQSETDNLGFHLFRSESEDGEYVQITRTIIRGAGSSASERQYNYIDNSIEAGKTYYYKLADVDYLGRMTLHGLVSVSASPPDAYVLEQNYPNPFNPETRIIVRLKESGFVTLSIYNLKGQQVRTLVSKQLHAGSHTLTWDGADQNGKQMPSGTYIYKMHANGYEVSRKMEFLK